MAGATYVAISDLVPFRLRKARELGLREVVDAREEELGEVVRAGTDGLGADVVFVTAPSEKALQAGLGALRKGGTLMVFAPTAPGVKWPVELNKLFFEEITITASYSTTHLETRDAMSIIMAHKELFGKLITHVFKLDEIDLAFRLAKEDKNCLKVVVRGTG